MSNEKSFAGSNSQYVTAMASASTSSSKNHILVVEDDPGIADMLVQMISENGHEASVAVSGPEMDVLMGQREFDLVVLDAMLPGEDGFSICRRLRASSTMPILMLTALGDDVDRIIGLELGADDYVTKPFNSRELMARIKGLLRRASYSVAPAAHQRPLTFEGWRIDPVSRQLFDPEGVHVSMTTAEFDILLAFCRNPGRIMNREQLLELTHAGTAGPIERSVDVHVSRIRQKIERNIKEPILIKTIRLGGYLFTPKVQDA
jgi:two-component system, OmpR family, response regulator